jgi:hypothetical protein
MEYLQISPNDATRWNSVWKLYEESFPEAERRKKGDHLRACMDERFFPLSAWDGRELVGLMFFLGMEFLSLPGASRREPGSSGTRPWVAYASLPA